MVMKSIWSCFFRREFLRGPFFPNLTDLNQSNIFIDDHWNIACLVNLEWACSHPVGIIHPPYWLTNQAIDLGDTDEHKDLHAEFMVGMAEEELEIKPPISLHSILQQGWERGTFWYALALSSPMALFSIFYDHSTQVCHDP
jgi:hypothetical protein